MFLLFVFKIHLVTLQCHQATDENRKWSLSVNVRKKVRIIANFTYLNYT